ncbi:unnamed protein product [Linum tenue]|uniref:Uncharacterized protein n=1 Tax=Linum tenue TaxID=586396 RepID=A0AAV0HPR0_9ROSI|nr:unnamed protein product [Linum tenue]
MTSRHPQSSIPQPPTIRRHHRLLRFPTTANRRRLIRTTKLNPKFITDHTEYRHAAHDGSDVTFPIQLRAEGVDVGKHVVAAISRDYGTEPTLRFKSVLHVWARLQPNLFPAGTI